MLSLLSLICILHSCVGFLEASNQAINNWAILVDSSAFWFNYRHASNVLGIYEKVRKLGIPDERIILMLADDIACNSRNVFPGKIVNNEREQDRTNLYPKDIDVDYRGHEVSVENFIRLLTNRMPESTPKTKLLGTDENSNILIFLTGHGGDNFFKFRNVEEISAHDLGEAFSQMWDQKRYREILFMIDTCQAGTMFSHFKSPNIFALASSKLGESSYSYTVDPNIGLSVTDRFSYQLHGFLDNLGPESTLQDLLSVFDASFMGSTPVHRADLLSRSPAEIKIFEFFADNRIWRHVHSKPAASLPPCANCKVDHIPKEREGLSASASKNTRNSVNYKISFEFQGRKSKLPDEIVNIVLILTCIYFGFRVLIGTGEQK